MSQHYKFIPKKDNLILFSFYLRNYKSIKYGKSGMGTKKIPIDQITNT